MIERTVLPYMLKQYNRHVVKSPLLNFSYNVYSQDGEDGILKRIFDVLSDRHRYFVEFGAWDGKYLSNCCNLIHESGWSGCFIEGDGRKFQILLNNHGLNPRISCLNKFVEPDGVNSLDNILSSLNDFRPRIVVIEFNPTVPNDVVFVQARNITINQGCSLLALIELGGVKGYELICCTGWNAFFVLKDFFPLFGILDNSIHAMYQPKLDGRIFHGYDSFVYTIGMPNFFWADIPITSYDFQLLPESLRRFKG